MSNNKGFGRGFAVGMMLGAIGTATAFANKKKIKARMWKLRAKAEIYQRLKDVKRLSRWTYDDIVEDVLENYRGTAGVSDYDLEDFADTLREKYDVIRRRWDYMQGKKPQAGEPDDDDEKHIQL